MLIERRNRCLSIHDIYIHEENAVLAKRHQVRAMPVASSAQWLRRCMQSAPDVLQDKHSWNAAKCVNGQTACCWWKQVQQGVVRPLNTTALLAVTKACNKQQLVE